MKRCPICSSVYDEAENFCVSDGTVLVLVPADAVPGAGETPTVVAPLVPAVQPRSVPASQTSPVVYAALGAMAVIILVLGGLLIFPRISGDSGIKTGDPAGNSGDSPVAGSRPTANAEADSRRESPTASLRTPEPLPANAVTRPPRPYVSPAGTWQGQWTNNKGSLFDQQLTLTDNGNGSVSGEVLHTLRRTVNPAKSGRIGLTAVEYVQGTYDPETRVIVISGVRKNDPNDLIILDKYRLSLSADGSVITGNTFGGRTRGQVSLRR